MAENDATEVTEGKLDFDEDNLRGEKKNCEYNSPCFRLETCVRFETRFSLGLRRIRSNGVCLEFL